MGVGDKIENTKDEWVGKAKEAAGDATDNRDLQAEGKAQETEGQLNQAGEKIKDVFK